MSGYEAGAIYRLSDHPIPSSTACILLLNWMDRYSVYCKSTIETLNVLYCTATFPHNMRLEQVSLLTKVTDEAARAGDEPWGCVFSTTLERIHMLP